VAGRGQKRIFVPLTVPANLPERVNDNLEKVPQFTLVVVS